MDKEIKINGKLLERVNRLVKKEDKKIKYSSTKQFINVAVLNLLEIESCESFINEQLINDKLMGNK